MTSDSGKNIRKSASKAASGGRSAAGQMPLVEVRYLDIAPKFNKPKRIHPRRLLPFVAEGPERGVHSMSSRVRMLRPQDDSQDVQILLNTPLTQPAQKATSSNVGEPSVSINDDVVVFTGNWYSAVSLDGGKTFQFIDPNSMAQPNDPPGVTFCCDQVVNYMPAIDTFVWLLQYGPRSGDNIQRLAFATTDQVKRGAWHTFDITTQFLGLPGFFMDFPDLAVSSKFLYMTTNAFGPDGSTVKSAVVRIDFDSIASGNPAPQKFVSDDLFSLRVAQNCQDVAYFAAHRNTSTLAVFSWPDGDLQPTSNDVPNARWLGTNGYISRTPDGRRWLDRADPRITGATLSGKELWFSWGVDAGSNHRAQPFVQMARINTDDMSLIEDVNLFDTESAICYGGLATNANGEVGVSYAIGGAVFPSHVVGFMSGNRNSVVVGKGDRSPVPDQDGHFDWGDYLTVRPVFRQGKPTNLFAATGYSMLGNQDGGNQDATPRLVIFGRAGAANGPPVGGNGGPIVVPGGNGGGDNGGNTNFGPGPITDVNTLRDVKPNVAAQIKAACGVHVGVQAFAAPLTPLPQLVTKPGKERWPVKTGQDPDRNDVGKNVIDGQNLGAGIVPATVEELMSMPRPAGMENAKIDPPQFQAKRAGPIERTIWRVEGFVTVLKQEADGDYHLVIQGNAGDSIVAEVPTPTTTFIGDSPWIDNIREARQAVDDKLVRNLNPRDFVLPPGGTKLVPRGALSGDLPVPAMANFPMPKSFVTPTEGEADPMPLPTFQTAIKSVPVRITGVGFFDRDHGQTGRAPNIFELHPVLKVEFP